MRKFSLLPVLAIVFALAGCNGLSDVVDNPVQLRSRADAAGEATIYIYFAVNKDQAENAGELLSTVSTVRDVLSGFQGSGFVSLLPEVERRLATKLVGGKLAYLPAAARLAQILLEELDKKATQDNWRDEAGVIASAIVSFLTGAERALKNHVLSADIYRETREVGLAVLKLPLLSVRPACAFSNCMTTAESISTGADLPGPGRTVFKLPTQLREGS